MVTLRPTSDGSELMSDPYGDTSRWQLVDDDPTNDNTGLITTDAGGLEDTIFNHSGDAGPATVDVKARVKHDRANASFYVLVKDKDDASKTVSAVFNNALANTWYEFTRTLTITKNINKYEFGIRMNTVKIGAAYYFGRCSELWLSYEIAAVVVKKPVWECKTRGGKKQEKTRFSATLKLGVQS